ncbi:MAG: OmpA family protein [Pseudarcicella sp.]|nr:OmpA family protein [Pseudarcicella sp.]MBP6410817.1 OmpA family protein [Pseudarcicella sp.]
MKSYLYLSFLSIALSACATQKYPTASNYPGNQQDTQSQTPSTPPPGDYPDGNAPVILPGERPSSTPSGTNSRNSRTSQDNGRSASSEIKVLDIKLTNDYTIVKFLFTNNHKPQVQNGRQVNDGSQNIGYSTSSYLIGGDGSRTFKFLKVLGIPSVNISTQDVNKIGYKLASGKSISFEVYFERLDHGIERFDVIECNYDQFVCWNIYDLFADNPLKPVVIAQPTPPTSPTPSTKTSKSSKTGEVIVKAPEEPKQNVSVSGRVLDIKTNAPVSATIFYKLSASANAVDSVQSFVNTGIYRMSLPKAQIYTYIASAKGYIAVSDVLDFSKSANKERISKDIYLTPIKVGDKISLNNIYFEVSKSDLLAASFAELNKLVVMMKENDHMEIRLEGHTDIVGDPEANLELSQERVNACESYLIKKGIATSRIQAIGYGDTKPIIKKGTDEERKVNRRVEFVVLKL